MRENAKAYHVHQLLDGIGDWREDIGDAGLIRTLHYAADVCENDSAPQSAKMIREAIVCLDKVVGRF